MPYKLTENQENLSFWSVIFLFYITTVNHFTIGLWHAIFIDFIWIFLDFIWQPAVANSVVEPRRRSKELSKARFSPKERHGHCLVVCCLSDPLELSESWQNHYIWEVCSANQWDTPKTTKLVNRKGPILLYDSVWPHVAQPTLQKLNKLGYKILLHPPHSPDFSPTN